MVLKDLQPHAVWEQFDALTQVPRPSKKEERVIEFLIEFAKRHNIEWQRDDIGNVVMRKPATAGYEGRPTVILQSHMDMVCEKNNDVEFDFDNDAIRAVVDGEWVRAEGTTLGADDGIGMAASMALLLDTEAEHGPLEVLFTVDEETGLTGAFNLGEGMLTGKYLINLDSEDEGEIFIGCAGGVDTVAYFALERTSGVSRSTVSMLCPTMSGFDAKTTSKSSGRASKSGIRSSIVALGFFARIASTVCAQCTAPPSGKSSRVTEVTTTCRSPIRATLSAICCGSSASGANGRPDLVAQKRQLRVQISPKIINVAVLLLQHSDLFGHIPLLQMVCSEWRFTIRSTSA